MTVIGALVSIAVIFILLLVYCLMKISSREDDLAEQEKYVEYLKKKGKEEDAT